MELQLGMRTIKAEVMAVNEYANRDTAADLYRIIEEK